MSGLTVSNFPQLAQPVVVYNSGSIDVSGSVGINNFPVDASGNLKTYIENPSLTVVNSALSNLKFDASGNLNVLVDNFPAVDISGSISVNNFPASQVVTNSVLSSLHLDPSGNQYVNVNNLFALDSTVQSSNTLLGSVNTSLSTLLSNQNLHTFSEINNGPIVAGGFTSALSKPNSRVLSVYGNSSGPTTLTLQFSHDNTNWYSSQYQITTGVGASDFGFSIECAVSYIRLMSSSAVTLLVVWAEAS